MDKLDEMTKPEFLLCVIYDACCSGLEPHDRERLIKLNLFNSKKDISNCVYILKLKGFIEKHDDGTWVLTNEGNDEAQALLCDFDVDYSHIFDDEDGKQEDEQPASKSQDMADANVAEVFMRIAACKHIANAFRQAADAILKDFIIATNKRHA